MTSRGLALAGALALAACAGPGAHVALEPHLDWPTTDDAGWAAAPALGVAAFADERPEELRAGYRPELRYRALGFAREGTEYAGDGDWDRPVAEAVRGDVVATLARAGTFTAVAPVDFDPRDPAAWPQSGAPALVLAGTVERFEGRQWHSLEVTPLRVGFVSERWGPASGRVSIRVEIWTKTERVAELRIATRHEIAGGGPAEAAQQALALASERLALRLETRFAAPRQIAPRKLDVRVLDGCALGAARVRRLLSETSAVYEREAGIVLADHQEDWADRPRGTSLDSLLEEVRRFAPPPGGIVLALAPEEQVRELGLRSVRTGLAVPDGAHAVALCGADNQVSVLTAAHEIAHLFGAVHVRDPASIMHATADFDARFFDPLNRHILRTMRERDFSRPLSSAESAELASIYKSSEPGDEVDRADLDSALRALDSASP
ncbi:MAG TPA: hypothetical protein VMR31_17020 [Myxococcota bacterium]|nr:hypothetical protein [Myxococcota bacterium]